MTADASSILTPAILRLPRALAVKYAKKKDENRIDELESAGNLGLVEALRRFDFSRGVSFVTYAYHWIEARIKNELGSRHRKRWARLGPLTDAAIRGLASGADDPSRRAEIADESFVARKILTRFKPIDRLIFCWYHAEGMTHKQIASRLGNSLGRAGVQNRLERMAKKIAVIVSRTGRKCAGGNPNPRPPRSEAQRLASGRAVRERALADRLAGKVPARKGVWYLADDARKTLDGPGRVAELLATRGVHAQTRGRGRLAVVMADPALAGLRLVRGKDARVLALDGGYVLSLPASEEMSGLVRRDAVARGAGV